MISFNNLSIRIKILLITFVGILGFFIYLVFNYLVIERNSVRLQEIKEISFPVLERVDANLTRLTRIRDTLNLAVSVEQEDIIEDTDKFAENFREAFKEIVLIAPPLKQKLEHLNEKFDGYYIKATLLTKDIVNGVVESSDIQIRASAMTKAFNTIDTELKEFRNTSYNDFSLNIDLANRESRSAIYRGLIIGFILITALCGTAFFVSNLITVGIRNVISAFQKMAVGNLTTRVAYVGNDEIGQLASSYNACLEKFENLICSINTTSTDLTDSSAKMSLVVNDTREGAFNQKAESDQIVVGMDELAKTSEDVSMNANFAAQETDKCNLAAQDGKKVVKNSIDAIQDLSKSIERFVQVIDRLQTDSKSIGNILAVIKNIADQTNLLALNAAIEAARAGDSGRGFAVVADEVRTLAVRTTESTQEIQLTVEKLQTIATEAASVMDEGSEKAINSVEQAHKVEVSLNIIANSVSNIADMNINIATAATEQSSVAQEMQKNVSRITEVATKTEEGAESTAQSSAQLEQLAGELRAVLANFQTISAA